MYQGGLVGWTLSSDLLDGGMRQKQVGGQVPCLRGEKPDLGPPGAGLCLRVQLLQSGHRAHGCGGAAD